MGFLSALWRLEETRDEQYPVLMVAERELFSTADNVIVKPASIGASLGHNVIFSRLSWAGAGTKIGCGAEVADFVVIGKQCEVEDFAKIGKGVLIKSGSLICAGAQVGEKCIIDECAYIRSDVTIGERCMIEKLSTILSGARIGDGIRIPAGAKIPAGAYIKRPPIVLRLEEWRDTVTFVKDDSTGDILAESGTARGTLRRFREEINAKCEGGMRKVYLAAADMAEYAFLVKNESEEE